MEHILKDSLEHFSQQMDFPLWEDKHLYTELNSPSGPLFEYEPFNYSINSFNALDMASSVADAGGHLYEHLHRKMPHPSSSVYNTNIPSPCIHDINESDEFWKDIVNNVDHNILEEKCSSDYCSNSITDILSSTPLAETNDLYSKPSFQALDSSFLPNVTKAENMYNQDSNVNICFLNSSKSIQAKKVSLLNFDCTSADYETNEELGQKSKIKKTHTLSNSPALNFLTFETVNNNATNTERKHENQIKSRNPNSCIKLLPRIADTQFLVCNKKSDSCKKMNMPQLNAPVSLKHNLDSALKNTNLNCSNIIMDPKMNNIATNTFPSVFPKNESKLLHFTETMPQMKACVNLKGDLRPAFIKIDSNCSNLIVEPKLKSKFHDKTSTVVDTLASEIPMSKGESKQTHLRETISSTTNQSATPKSLAEKRKQNKLSVLKYKSISSIKIDKKGSFLSLPTNSLSTLMVRDLLQMSGCKNERSIKELTLEYRANVVKIMQQKQLRLRRMDSMS